MDKIKLKSGFGKGLMLVLMLIVFGIVLSGFVSAYSCVNPGDVCYNNQYPEATMIAHFKSVDGCSGTETRAANGRCGSSGWCGETNCCHTYYCNGVVTNDYGNYCTPVNCVWGSWNSINSTFQNRTKTSVESCGGTCSGSATQCKYYNDFDHDNYGNLTNLSAWVDGCTGAPVGAVTNSNDCNDLNASVWNASKIWYIDADNDGWFNQTTTSCNRPVGGKNSSEINITHLNDCNDANFNVKPNATEVCDNLDNDCDGSIDEGFDICCAYSNIVSNPSFETNYFQGWNKTGDYYVVDANDIYSLNTTSDGNKKVRGCYGTGKAVGYCADLQKVSQIIDVSMNSSKIDNGELQVVGGCNAYKTESIEFRVEFLNSLGSIIGNSKIVPQRLSQWREYCSEALVPIGTRSVRFVFNSSLVNGENIDVDVDECFVRLVPKVSSTCYESCRLIEICNNLDDNFDGVIDEGCDDDGDHYADISMNCSGSFKSNGVVYSCINNGNDCDDDNSSIHPGVSEVCDGIDNNCNGQTDEGVGFIYYRDFDGDTFGNFTNTTYVCSLPVGYVANSNDCNDNNISVWNVNQVWYIDADNDGWYSSTTMSCNRPVGGKNSGEINISHSNDCNDSNYNINPSVTEICDGVDNNCNSQTDEGIASVFISNQVGMCAGNNQICFGGIFGNNASNYVPTDEVCDGNDNDCDGETDEVCGSKQLIVEECGNTSYSSSDVNNLISIDSYNCNALNYVRSSSCTEYPVIPLNKINFSILFHSDSDLASAGCKLQLIEVGSNTIKGSVYVNGNELFMSNSYSRDRGSCSEYVTDFQGFSNIKAGNNFGMSNAGVIAGNNILYFSGLNNANIRQISLSCPAASSQVITYSVTPDNTYYEVNGTIRMDVKINANDLKSFSNSSVLLRFPGISPNYPTVTKLPSFCTAQNSLTNSKDFDFTCIPYYNNFSIEFKLPANQSYPYLHSFSYINYSGLNVNAGKGGGSITVSNVITSNKVNLTKSVVFVTSNDEYKNITDLNYGDSIKRIELTCDKDSSGAEVVIRNVNRKESYPYYTNLKLGNSNKFVFATLNSYNNASLRLGMYPLVIERSGLYVVEANCYYTDVSSGNCSGKCFNPLSSTLPTTWSGWKNYFSVGKTFLSLSNDNSILDCVCTSDMTLKPIVLYNNAANIVVQSQPN